MPPPQQPARLADRPPSESGALQPNGSGLPPGLLEIPEPVLEESQTADRVVGAAKGARANPRRRGQQGEHSKDAQQRQPQIGCAELLLRRAPRYSKWTQHFMPLVLPLDWCRVQGSKSLFGATWGEGSQQRRAPATALTSGLWLVSRTQPPSNVRQPRGRHAGFPAPPSGSSIARTCRPCCVPSAHDHAYRGPADRPTQDSNLRTTTT